MIMLLIWGLDRGFDIADEGGTLLLCRDPYLYTTFSSYYFVLNRLPHLLSSDVCNLRLWNLIARVISSVVLGWGTWSWLNSLVPSFKSKGLCLCLCALAVIGNLWRMGVSWPTADYNDLSNFAILVAGGLLLKTLSVNEENSSCRRQKRVLLSIVGAFTGLAFFARFTAALLFYMVVAAINLMNKDRVFQLAAQAVGMFLVLLLYFACIENPVHWYGIFSRQIPLEFAKNHSVAKVATSYWGSFADLFSEFWRHFYLIFPVMIVAVCVLMRTRTSPNALAGKLATLSSTIVAGYLCFELFQTGYYLYPTMYWSVGLLVAVMLGIIFLHAPRANLTKLSGRKSLIVGLLLLSTLASIASVGTNGPILFLSLSNLPPCLLFSAVVCLLVGHYFRSWACPLFVMGLLSGCCFLQFFTVYFYHPCRLATPLALQNEPVQVPALAGMKLSSTENQFFSEAYRILSSNGFQQGDPILAFYHIPGFVYGVGGTGVGRERTSANPNREEMDCVAVETLPTRKLSRLYLATTKGLSLRMIQCMEGIGIRFPQDFQKLGSVANPSERGRTIDIYRLRADHPRVLP